MAVKVSSKYQVVIPKSIRRQLNIKPGQHLVVTADHDTVIIKKDVSNRNVSQWIERYAGTAKGAWGKDPARTIRQLRNTEWD